jgi:hypothetical protein
VQVDFVGCLLYIKKYLQAGKPADRRQHCFLVARGVSFRFNSLKRRRRMRRKSADTQEPEPCVGMQEKAALLEQGFHVLKALEESGQATFQWRDEEGAQAADKSAHSACFCGKK